MEAVKDAISAVRARRAEMNVPPSKKAQLIIVTEHPADYEQGRHFITRMAYGKRRHRHGPRPPRTCHGNGHGGHARRAHVYLPLS